MGADDEDISEWADIPLFAPPGSQVPNLSTVPGDEAPSTALSALSHLLYDEESPREKSELLRNEGNRYFKRRDKRSIQFAICKYSAALDAAEGDIEPTIAALNNRAAAHLRLGNYGYALSDATRVGELDQFNVKAHFRAAVAATHAERLKTAQLEIEAGLKACREGHGNDEDIASLRRQEKLLRDVVERVENRKINQDERKSRLDEAKEMMKTRGIRVGHAEYAQQHEYKITTPQLIDGEWCWPVLLVYSTQSFGEQSDYLECVGETVTMKELLQTVLGDGTETPWWDVDRIYHSHSSMKIRFRRGEAYVDGDVDEGYRVSEKEWGDIDMNESIANLLARKDYVLPSYPVIHITGYDSKT